MLLSWWLSVTCSIKCYIKKNDKKRLSLNANFYSNYMQFEPNNIYHIYNRVNNSQILFFNRENYLFFLQKVKTYITPFSDILARCLMPNHFHLMVYVNCVEIEISEQVTESHQLTRKRILNDSISILLRSYVRAI